MVDSILKRIPLILFILLIIYPFLTYLLFKDQFIYFSIPFFLYLFYRTINFAIGATIGWFRYRKEKGIDWQKRIKNEKLRMKEHLIVIPVYKEDFKILKRTIDSILAQNYPQDKFHLSITIEDREDFNELSSKLIETYENKIKIKVFRHVLTELEVAGAASNRTFGAKSYVKNIAQSELQNFLITSPDADTVFNKNYFSRVTYQYLNDIERENSFYQTGVYKFDNNYWNVPTLIRVLSIGLTLSVLSSSTYDAKNRFTFSCFTMNLQTMMKVGFWDTALPIDDTPFYWRAFKKLNGNFKCKIFYISLSVDAIHSDNYLKTHIKQYQQYYRWGWGVIAFPLAVKAISESQLSLVNKIYRFWKIFEIFILVKVLPLIITLYVVLGIESGIIGIIANINLILIIPLMFTKFKLVAENSKINKGILFLLILFEIPFGIVSLLTYGIVPYVHAATGLAIGKNPDKKIKWSIKLLTE